MNTNDHEIVIGSTTQKLQLAQDDNGSAIYTVGEEVPEHRDKVIFAQSDWSGGVGQYEAIDGISVLDGQNIDISKKGEIFLGPRWTGTTHYVNATYVFLDDGGAFTDYSTAAGNMTTDDVYPTAAVPAVNDALYIGAAAKFSNASIYVSVAGAGTWTITWEIWDGSVWNSTGVSSTTDWKSSGFRTVSITAGAQALWALATVNAQSAYWLRARVSAYTSITTRCVADRVWVASSTVTPLEMRVSAPCNNLAAGEFYFADYTSLYLVYSNYNAYHIFTAGSPITDMCEHDGIMYIACGVGSNYYYRTAKLVFAQTDLVDHHAYYFCSAPNPDHTAMVLWKALAPNLLSNTSDGRAVAAGGVAWSTPAYIGDESYDITSLFLHNDNLMIGKENSLYQYTTDGGTEIYIDNSRDNISVTYSENYSRHCAFQGNTYFNLNGRLAELTGYDRLSYIGAEEVNTKVDKWGQCMGIATDGKYLYELVVDNPDCLGFDIYKGWADASGWHWSPIVNFTPTEALYYNSLHAYQDSGGKCILWFGSDKDGISYAYTAFDPLTDEYYFNYLNTAFVRMSYTYGTDPYWDKVLLELITETSGCSAGVYVQPKYYKDNDTGASSLSSNITTNGTVQTALTSVINGKRFAFQLNLVSSSMNYTPIVRKFGVLGYEVPVTYRVHDCTYKLESDPNISASTLRAFLRTGRTSTSLIKFADLRYGEKTSGTAGTDYHYVRMAPGYPREIEVAHARSRTPELAVQIRWVETNYA